jgi:hypothetical protein
MKVDIAVDIVESGNPRRGYHNYDTTIKFAYGDESSFTADKEHRIVIGIIGEKDNWMWHKVSSVEEHTWKANYGYDSGD